MVEGVFFGWHLQPGHKWNGEYVVSALSNFVGKDLRARARASDCNVRLEKVRLICRPAVATFPLKEIYDRHNRTLSGLAGELMDPLAAPMECSGEDEFPAIPDTPMPADPREDEDLFCEGDEDEPAIEDPVDLDFSEVPDGYDPSVYKEILDAIRQHDAEHAHDPSPDAVGEAVDPASVPDDDAHIDKTDRRWKEKEFIKVRRIYDDRLVGGVNERGRLMDMEGRELIASSMVPPNYSTEEWKNCLRKKRILNLVPI